MYRFLFSVLLTRIPAEIAHQLSFGLLRLLMAVPPLRWAAYRCIAPRDATLRVRALGRDLPGPLGLAAGFDKDARGCDALGALGFGYVEIGTVTGQPQPGNPKPRLFRLTADRALVNRMGFNNDGSAAAAERLRQRRSRGRSLVVGANIGKTKLVDPADAIADYVRSTELLAPVVDYLVVNVSSPNTPGLRDLQAVDQLRPLLSAVRARLDETGHAALPLLVKIAPDLADEDVDAVTDLALELGLTGIIATDTTTSREGLATPAAEVAAAGAGGVSGAPLRDRALQVLRRIRARAGDRLTLIAVGGIETADDAWARIRAGATLVQGYTGLIYGGPFWAWRIHRGLAARVRRAGLRDISAAIGLDAR